MQVVVVAVAVVASLLKTDTNLLGLEEKKTGGQETASRWWQNFLNHDICTFFWRRLVSIQLTWDREVLRIGSSCQRRHHTNIYLHDVLRKHKKSYYRLHLHTHDPRPTPKTKGKNVPATKRRLTNDVR